MKLAIKKFAHSDPNAVYFELPFLLQFVLWFIFILVVKFNHVDSPPVWDTAMGIFPPAIYLAENGFNLLQLIQQPNWFEAGPNVHSFSTWTWLTASVIWFFEDTQSVFRTLHLITFVLSAWAVATFVRLLRTLQIRPSLALTSGILLCVIPLVLVQTGYMYVEIPVMALSLLAATRWSEGKEGHAVFLALLATSIKLTGAVISLVIALLLLVRIIRQSSVRRIFYLICLPSLIVLMQLLPWLLGGIARDASPSWEFETSMWHQLLVRLIAAPDITLLVAIGLLSGMILWVCYWRREKKRFTLATIGDDINSNSTAYLMVLFPFVFVAGIVFMILMDKMFLQRYLVPMLPFSIAQIVLLAQFFNKQKSALWLLVMASLFACLNYNGRFYSSARAFSVVETTHAYENYVLDQKIIIEQISKLDDTTPIYVSREIFYLTSHPQIGYLKKSKPNLVAINQARFDDISLDELEDAFYIVVTDRYHGGQRLRAIMKEARSRTDWNTRKFYRQNIDDRSMYLAKIERISGAG